MDFVTILPLLWLAPVWAQNPLIQGKLKPGQYISTGFSFVDTSKGKSIAALMRGGLPFSPSPMKVRGRLPKPNEIVIEGYDSEKNLLLPSKDSIVPLEFNMGFPGGQLSAGAKLELGVSYSHAANTTWRFTKPKIVFEADGVT